MASETDDRQAAREIRPGARRALTRREMRLVLRALLPYAAFGTLWFLFADSVAEALADPYQLEAWEDYKGWLFLAISMFLIYALVRGEQVARLRTEAQFNAAFATTPDPMAIVRLEDGLLIEVNEEFTRALGWDREEIVGRKTLTASVLPDESLMTTIRSALRASGAIRNLEAELQTRHGDVRAVLLSARPVLGRRGYAVVAAKDVTDLLHSIARLESQALRDPLTGLPNRTLLVDRLEQELARAERSDRVVAALSLNLDRFRVVNATLGHAAGDRLLVEVANRLRSCLRRADTVSRYQGLPERENLRTQDSVARVAADEYAVVIGDLRRHEDAIVVMERIRDALAHPFDLEGRELAISARVGLAMSPGGGRTAEELLRHAAIAGRRAKEKGLGRYHVFDPAVDYREERRLRLEADLQGASERQELELRYQPIVSLRSGRIAGFESLVRWRHPERGLLSALEFISVAEESGLVISLGRWMMERSCRWIAERNAGRRRPAGPDGEPPLRITVNVSAPELLEPDLPDLVAAALEASGLDPACLELEITESALMQSIAILQNLKRLGVRLAVDDFGTGYSGLSYLSRLPVDTLKIDQSFVQEIGTNPQSEAVVRAVVAMGRSLELDVVAEGIETEEQLALLRKAECTYGQGYLFARPLRPEDAEALLKEDRLMFDEPVRDGRLPHPTGTCRG